MSQHSSKMPLSPELKQVVDTRCDAFELAWKGGECPRIEDHLNGVAKGVRPHLIRALLLVEMDHRRAPDGDPATEQQLIELHPQLATDLMRAFQEIRTLGTERAAADDLTLRMPASANEIQQTIEHTPGAKDSRGLRIRCPHCSNRVELLADTPYDDICCSVCGSTFHLADRGDETTMASPLKTIDRFDLVSRLGVGGFGTVWKARDRELDRTVAVKIPRRGQLGPTEVEQFYREARAAAQLRHANIVPVHEVGRDGETMFIVSDFVRGVTLSSWLTGHRPSPSEVAELGIIIAGALKHAHDHGVIHRDLKPSNIMIDEEGQPHLMDFGLAKREVGEITMTVDGQVLGTPAYMSPEQAGGDGRWTDRRTDLYSFGVILFEMLTGELPFRGNSQMQVHQRLTEEPPDPRKLNPHVPRDLATICLKLMEREPGRRYANAGELGAEFQRFLNGEPILARPLSSPARLARWAKRKPMVATTAALTIFLAIAGPLTALAIERQRIRLEELVVEKDNLIDRNAIEKEQDAARITELTRQLDAWEGRAKPWEYWPPKRDNAARLAVLGGLYQHAASKLANPAVGRKDVGGEQVYADLSLAMMADAAVRTPEAIAAYERARDRLMALRDQNPQQPSIARALADCYANLARLVGVRDRDRAGEYLESARAIYEQLGAARPTDVACRLEWLNAELDCATLAGFEPGMEHLRAAARIKKSLPADWPNTPDEIYRLACYLTDREPLLVTTDAATGN